MKWLCVLAVVLLVLFLIGQIRVGGGAEFNALGFFAWVRVGALNVRVFPLKKKDKKKKKKKTPKNKGKKPKNKTGSPPGPAGEAPEGPAAGSPSAPAAEEPKEPALEKLGGVLDYALALLPIGLDAAAQFGKKLQIDRLRLELTVGADDPADAAIRYGQGVAALGMLWGPLTQAFSVKDGEARALVDFGADRITVYGSAALSLKIGQIVRLGLYFGWKALWAFLGVRKEHKQERSEEAKQRKAA